jgi:hypothetical protein
MEPMGVMQNMMACVVTTRGGITLVTGCRKPAILRSPSLQWPSIHDPLDLIEFDGIIATVTETGGAGGFMPEAVSAPRMNCWRGLAASSSRLM